MSSSTATAPATTATKKMSIGLFVTPLCSPRRCAGRAEPGQCADDRGRVHPRERGVVGMRDFRVNVIYAMAYCAMACGAVDSVAADASGAMAQVCRPMPEVRGAVASHAQRNRRHG